MSGERRILLVGGSGFIGSHLARRLAGAGYRTRVLARDGLRFAANLGDVSNVELVLGDVSNRGDVASALDDVTDVVYLVHSTVPESSMRDLAFDLASNVPAWIAFLERLRESERCRRVVYVSSGGAIYGDPARRLPVTEGELPRPISSYGLTKLVAEHYLRLQVTDSRLSGIVLRPSNVYGERQNFQRPQGAVGHFLRALAEDRPVILYGDGSIVRDHLYVGDLVRAVELTLLADAPLPGRLVTLNVGSGNGISMREMLGLAETITRREARIEARPDRSFDCRYNVLSCEAIRSHVGWRPKVDLEDGLRRTWRWVCEATRR